MVLFPSGESLVSRLTYAHAFLAFCSLFLQCRRSSFRYTPKCLPSFPSQSLVVSHFSFIVSLASFRVLCHLAVLRDRGMSVLTSSIYDNGITSVCCVVLFLSDVLAVWYCCWYSRSALLTSSEAYTVKSGPALLLLTKLQISCSMPRISGASSTSSSPASNRSRRLLDA